MTLVNGFRILCLNLGIGVPAVAAALVWLARQHPLRRHGAVLMPLSKLVEKPCIKLTGIGAGARQSLLSNRRRLAQSLLWLRGAPGAHRQRCGICREVRGNLG